MGNTHTTTEENMMTLQTMYDYIRTHPNTTANIPASVRRAPVGIAYDRASRLVQLGFVRESLVRIRGRECTGYVARYNAPAEYRHSGQLVVKRMPL
jgi:hypothetical protein